MTVSLTVLGSAQDGGVPQPGCTAQCCGVDVQERFPVSLGLRDDAGSNHLIEATRDLGRQLRLWGVHRVDSVTLTHAHLGHVDGLGLFGREAIGRAPRLHVSEAMADLVRRHPQWSQIPFDIQPLCRPESDVHIEGVAVPHRSELADNHAILFRGTARSLLFLPDHDDWGLTLAGIDIRDWLAGLEVDIALLDGTFWSAQELAHRDMSAIPHPPVEETLRRLGPRREGDPEIRFIHLNHTNPLCRPDSAERHRLLEMGWDIAEEGDVFAL